MPLCCMRFVTCAVWTCRVAWWNLRSRIDRLDMPHSNVEQLAQPHDQEFKLLMSSMRKVQMLRVTAPSRGRYPSLSILKFIRGMQVCY